MPFAAPTIEAGFQFNKDSAIFATGSCFARNVEKSLHFIGANVVSSPIEILTDHKFAWGNKDFRHVRQATVDRIMAEVLRAYVGPSDKHQLLYAQALRQVGRREDSIAQCRLLMNLNVGQSQSAGRTAVNTMRMLKNPEA